VKRLLLLLRHGQSTWNAEERWQGHADPPLSELGEHQARAAAAGAARLGVRAVYSSDLTRARQTAADIAPAGITPLVEPVLRERDVGVWTGMTTTEIDEQYPGYRAAHRSPPGFEGDESLVARVVPALEAIAGALDPDAVAIVVTHGGVIRTIEKHLGGVQAPVPNLGGRWVHYADGALSLGDREVLIDPEDEPLTIPTEQ
jgi:glucosyl-3-phosphoglycerate phosphatase